MKNTTLCWLVAATAACTTSLARADIAYDSISTFAPPPTQGFLNLPVQADDITLDAGANLTVTRIELLTRLRSMAPFTEFNGTMTLRLYAGGGFVPGALLAEATRPLVVARGTDVLTGFDLNNFTLPGRTFFVGWFFTMSGQPNIFSDMWVRQNSATPSIGISTINYFATGLGAPQWSVTNQGGSNYAVRITTVPAPAALAVLALGALRTARRRRAIR